MSKESDYLLQTRVEQLKLIIRESGDSRMTASQCGMEYSENAGTTYFSFSLFNSQVKINYPELIIRDVCSGENLSTAQQALVCYYMTTTITSPEALNSEDKWISFADLPDGRFYNQAFQSYTGNKLASKVEANLQKFSSVAYQMNGENLDYGDVAYRFLALPKVPVAVVYWAGDEDFSPSCKILFDATARFYLPTDACAILGSMITQIILKKINI